MKTWLVACGLATVGSAFGQGPVTTTDGSLFNKVAERGLIGRRTASRKGDILTIVVNEVSKGQFTASTTTNRTEAATANAVSIPVLDVFAGPVLGGILGKGVSNLAKNVLKGGTTGGTQASTGGGSASNVNNYTATMTVIVTEVDENGNLHVQGTRAVQVNKETQTMVLTGLVRQDDVTPENTVPSEKIANADIRADGKGAVAEKTRRSVLGKILDWLF